MPRREFSGRALSANQISRTVGCRVGDGDDEALQFRIKAGNELIEVGDIVGKCHGNGEGDRPGEEEAWTTLQVQRGKGFASFGDKDIVADTVAAAKDHGGEPVGSGKAELC